MKNLLLFLFSIVLYPGAYAQLQNDSLEYRIKPDSIKAGTLALSIYNFNFLRNYEFFNDFQDGYTLFGTQLEPRLVYYVNPKLVVSAGINARKDFGKDGLNKSYPIFTIKYQNKNFSLVNGVIEGNVNHRMIEPIFDFEQKISRPVEYGTQFIINKPSLFMDAFINWQRMTEPYSALQEQIYAGLSSDISLYQKAGFKLSIPVQGFVFHQGGQIDTDPSPLKTIANTALGFKVQYNRTGFVKQLQTENYLVSYSELSPTKVAVFSEGKGIFLNAGLQTRLGNLTGSYWEGNKYVSPVGMPIYQSVSQNIGIEGYSEKIRKLIFLRYTYQKQLVSNFYFDFRVEPVFDLKSPGSKSMEFYHSMFLLYKQDFKLFKKK